MIVAPCHLLALIQIYVFPAGPDSEASADGLVAAGLASAAIDRCGRSVYGLTDKGKKWLEMLLETPFPEQHWVDPRTEKERLT